MSKLYAIRQTGKSNYWYDFVEDFTSAELDEHCVSNDFVYVKECQNNLGDLNPAWKNSEIVELGIVADLEVKLAESKESCILLEGLRKSEAEKKDIAMKRVSELKQQLAEVKNSCDYYMNRANDLLIKNQDKISFALEQLEKVKEKLLEELQNVTDLLDPLEYEDYHEFIGCGRGYKNSIEEIDNQIKQLKEGK